MRKQTKLVAVTSAAALLAIGASMTSFAATGWVEEAGDWYYYDSDGYVVEDEWKKSGDQWFWLSSELGGAMAVDTLVEDDDDIYYVDSNGAMVTSTWIKVVNEDQDDDDWAEYHYYYMASSGKAYSTDDDLSLKTIDGKRYAFDDEGKMLYGWVTSDGEMQTDEDGWATDMTDTDEDMYYFGEWYEGDVKTGWQYISVVDDDDDMDYWFYFNSNGTRFCNENSDSETYDEKKINSIYYGFDYRGVMVYQWNVESASAASSSTSIAAEEWSYFSDPESGARVSKGWFKVIAPTEDTTFTDGLDDANSFDEDNAYDETEKWYYSVGSSANEGKLAQGEIKSIGGKYYAFHPTYGYMLTGLVLLDMGEDGEIDAVIDGSVDADELAALLNNDEDGKTTGYSNPCMYYFGDSDDGSMKTGATTIELDGTSYSFKFSTSGGAEGKGIGYVGIDGNYIYAYGCRIKADSDDKYQLVYCSEDETEVYTLSSSALRKSTGYGTFYEIDSDGDKDRTVKVSAGSIMADALEVSDIAEVYLVNTSGTITKNKSAGKDGAEWYFFVDDYEVKAYANDKDLDDLGTSDSESQDVFADWEDIDYTTTY